MVNKAYSKSGFHIFRPIKQQINKINPKLISVVCSKVINSLKKMKSAISSNFQ